MLLPLTVSLIKKVLPLLMLASGLYLGWKHDEELDFMNKVPLMMAVVLSTFSPIGLILFVKFWETNPPFSAACGKQALVGLTCYCIFHAIR
ncbi:MAG: hypothetical protein WA705_19385 [Candidatus Ozemobacteraceae bacterium]